MPQARIARLVLGLVLALGFWCASSPAAWAQFVLAKAYPAAALAGPKAAKGAVIWNHGKPPAREAGADMLPYYLDELAGAGWDVYRLDRDWSYDTLAFSAQALREKVTDLHQRGYDRVVLAGQSYGAWISFIVAADGPPIHAVIATAPAAFGKYPDSSIWRDNAKELYPILDRIRGTRVMMFLFNGDDYDPGNRGEVAQRLFERHGVDSQVVAYPEGWNGHGAANWPAFSKRFGHCIADFVDPARKRGASAGCGTDPRGIATLPIAIPRNFPLSGGAVSAGSGGDVPPLAGIWYGTYSNGREAVLAIENLTQNRVTAIYAWGRMRRDEKTDPDFNHRHGVVEGGELKFAEAGFPTLRAKLRPDGRLELDWSSEDGESRISGVLSRLN
jgi:pimeloyl-ACP methyl ester carboxylesterase